MLAHSLIIIVVISKGKDKLIDMIGKNSFQKEILNAVLSKFHSNKVAMINWRDTIYILPVPFLRYLY